MLLMAFLGGVLADRFNRRKLLMAADTLMAATLVALTVNALQPTPHVNLLFAAAAFLAALNSVHRPAIEAMTPQLVRLDEMTAVSALNSIRHNIAYIAGLAGWIAVKYGAAIAFGSMLPATSPPRPFWPCARRCSKGEEAPSPGTRWPKAGATRSSARTSWGHI